MASGIKKHLRTIEVYAYTSTVSVQHILYKTYQSFVLNGRLGTSTLTIKKVKSGRPASAASKTLLRVYFDNQKGQV